MRCWKALASLVLGVAIQGAIAEEVELNAQQNLKCEGMFSQKAWGGPVEPHILTKFLHYESTGESDTSDHIISLVIFDWRDRASIGTGDDNDPMGRTFICDQMAVEANVCTPEQFGEFIIAANATDRVHTQAVNLKSETLPAVNFAVQKTGYYCVDARPMDDNTQFTAIAEFRNAYGELPGAQIAKLPFYGGLTIVYAVVGIFWAFLYVQNRSDILPVQNYITATIIFLVVEMLLTWAYYDFLNRHGFSTGAKALMLVVSILNAARNSLSFFLLLIVCMGYGVVKPTLGKTMIFVRWLAITHFVFGVIYAVGSLTIRPEDAGPLVLLVVLPLAATGTAFYVWTLNSLGATMKDLVDRKQKVKVLMYRKLWWCILGSVLVIFLFFFANVVLVTGQTGDFTPDHWQTRWFVLDGWLNLVYLADVAYICYLWRPTANNRRFAMSDELAQDDEGFEIASVGRDSLDMDDEEEHRQGYSGLSANGNTSKQTPSRGASPLPAPQPQRPAKVPRDDSLDGETIFAVGDDGDRFSEDEGNEDERRGLTHKGD